MFLVFLYVSVFYSPVFYSYKKRFKSIDGWRSKLRHFFYTSIKESSDKTFISDSHFDPQRIHVKERNWGLELNSCPKIHETHFSLQLFMKGCLLIVWQFYVAQAFTSAHCTACFAPLARHPWHQNCCHPWIHRLPQWRWLKLPLCGGCLLSASIFCCFVLPFTCVCVVPLQCP